MSAPARSRWPLALAAFVLGSLLTAGVGGGLWYRTYAAGGRPAADAADRPVFPRPEFSRRVMGKPEAEVLKAVGQPDATSEDGGSKFWHYKRRTRDPLTDATDTDVQVVVFDGKVTGINY